MLNILSDALLLGIFWSRTTGSQDADPPTVLRGAGQRVLRHSSHHACGQLCADHCARLLRSYLLRYGKTGSENLEGLDVVTWHIVAFKRRAVRLSSVEGQDAVQSTLLCRSFQRELSQLMVYLLFLGCSHACLRGQPFLITRVARGKSTNPHMKAFIRKISYNQLNSLRR